MNRLLVDAGQSAIRVRWTTVENSRDWTLPPLRTSEDVADQIQSVVVGALPRGFDDVTVAVAVSGLDDANELAQRLIRSCADRGVDTVLSAHDSVTGYLACLGLSYGAVSAVGTGVVTLGVGSSECARVDGWGNIMGDAGSGYWIGRAALEAAMRAYDGRGQDTALLDILRQDFPDVELAYLELQQDPDRVSRVASYARKALQIVDIDPVSAAIADDAAAELALSLSAALTRVGWLRDQSPTVSWTGGIMANARVTSQLTRAIERDWPRAHIVQSLGEPIDGVALLPDISSDHPLSRLVSTASHSRVLQ